MLIISWILIGAFAGLAHGEGTPRDGAIPGFTWREKFWVADQDGMAQFQVSAGVFTMGSNEGRYDEAPAHLVDLDGYLMDLDEVSNRQFNRFVEVTGYRPRGPWKRGFSNGQEDFPVRFVSWFDAQAYAAWAGRQLPTEAQWEKAARGIGGGIYPWGAGWDRGRARADLDVQAGPAPVGSFPGGASPWGGLDLGGNVWEWTADSYDRFQYESRAGRDPVRNPTGPVENEAPEERFLSTDTAAGNERYGRRVIRGGGWSGLGRETLRCSRRAWGNPTCWSNDTGFRLVYPLPTNPAPAPAREK